MLRVYLNFFFEADGTTLRITAQPVPKKAFFDRNVPGLAIAGALHDIGPVLAMSVYPTRQKCGRTEAADDGNDGEGISFFLGQLLFEKRIELGKRHRRNRSQ